MNTMSHRYCSYSKRALSRSSRSSRSSANNSISTSCKSMNTYVNTSTAVHPAMHPAVRPAVLLQPPQPPRSPQSLQCPWPPSFAKRNMVCFEPMPIPSEEGSEASGEAYCDAHTIKQILQTDVGKLNIIAVLVKLHSAILSWHFQATNVLLKHSGHASSLQDFFALDPPTTTCTTSCTTTCTTACTTKISTMSHKNKNCSNTSTRERIMNATLTVTPPFAFHQANCLLDRALHEIAYLGENNPYILSEINGLDMMGKIDTQIINQVLETWKIANIYHFHNHFTSRMNGHYTNNTTTNNTTTTTSSSATDKYLLFIQGEAILDKCSQVAIRYQQSGFISHPDVHSYNIILDCYAKLQMEQEAQNLFSKMQQLAANNNAQTAQNYAACIGMNSTTTTTTTATTTTNYGSNSMEQYNDSHDDDHKGSQYMTSIPQISPNTESYNILISMYSKSARNDAGRKAEELLNAMESIYRRNSNDGYNGDDNCDNDHVYDHVRPDETSYNHTILAYENCKDDVAADRLVMRMHQAYLNGHLI